MRVAVYHPWVYLKGGIERTLLELVKRSQHQWTVYTSHYDAAGTFPGLADVNLVELSRVSVRRSYLPVLKAFCKIALTKIDPASYDVLVICCDGPGTFLTLRNSSKPVVCLCFTPLRTVYDDHYRARHLRKYGALKFIPAAIGACFKRLDRLMWGRYDKVFAISNTVAKRVAEGRLAALEKIEIAHPGVSPDIVQPSRRRDRYLLVPGRIMWTKDVELAIRAFCLFKEQTGSDFRMIVAGMVDQKSRPYIAHLREVAADEPGIEFVENPSDVQLDELYRNAYCGVHTAFNEDWGLTPLECLARGKPVIAVNCGGPTEVIEHFKTGLLVEGDAGALARAIRFLVEHPDLVEQWGATACERALDFTWDVFVNRLDRSVESLEAATAPAAAVLDEAQPVSA